MAVFMNREKVVICLFSGLLCLFLTTSVNAQGLISQLTPGGVFVGKTAPNSQIFYEGKALQVAADGRFIIGFGRDVALDQSYREVLTNGQERRHYLTLKPRVYNVQRLTGIAKKFVSLDKLTLSPH